MTVHVYETFKSRKKAEKWLECYLMSYHPAGYGTSLRIWKSMITGQWIVAGTRSHTCD